MLADHRTGDADSLSLVRSRLAAVVAIVFAISALGLSSVAAHTEVWQRSPEQGQAYGGTIDELQISFFATVTTSEITIDDPNGDAVAVGTTTLAQGDRIAVVEFPALAVPGPYVVTHTELAEDGDTQTASFQFFYDPSSENEVTSLILGDDGPNWPLLGIIAGVVMILVGLFWPGRSGK